MNQSTSDASDSEDEVFFGPVKIKESPLVNLYSKRKTEFFNDPNFRRKTEEFFNNLSQTLYLDNNFDVGAEEYVETTTSPNKSVYFEENFTLGAEEIVESSSSKNLPSFDYTLVENETSEQNPVEARFEEENAKNKLVETHIEQKSVPLMEICCRTPPNNETVSVDDATDSSNILACKTDFKEETVLTMGEFKKEENIVSDFFRLKEEFQSNSLAENVNVDKNVVSNVFLTKKKQERRLSRCFNELKNNSRVSLDNNRKISAEKIKSIKPQKVSTPAETKNRPKMFTKTPETLLKSTLKKNYRKALTKSVGARLRNISPTSSPEGLHARNNNGNGLENKNVDLTEWENKNFAQIWTNLSSSDDTGSSQSSEDGEICDDLLNFAIARTIDKHTPPKYAAFRYPHHLLDF